MKAKPNLPVIVRRMFDYVHKDGPNVKLAMLNDLQNIIDQELWKQYLKPDGTEPKDVGEWLRQIFPHGPEIGQSDSSLTYSDLQQLAESAGQKRLVGVLAKHAGRGKGGDVNLYNIKNAPAKAGTSREYLLRRLQKESPKEYQGWLNGEHKSVHAAAVAAGIVKSNGHDPLMRLKSNWRKASKRQRTAFLKWIESDESN